ncbi:MAG: urea transporter [Chloroflexi bacterium]|nr:urea transporter [Chloroflexota bacterium]
MERYLISRLCQFIDLLSRGYTFILLVNHPAAGAALCVALFLLSPWAGAAALAGNAAATLVTLAVLKVDPGTVRYGVFGGNGLFVGLAWAPLIAGNVFSLPFLLAAAALCALLTYLWQKTMLDRLNMPALIVPFLAVTWLGLPLIRFLGARLGQAVLAAPSWWLPAEEAASRRVPGPFMDMFHGLGYLFYQDSMLIGLVVFFCWFVAGWKTALTAATAGAGVWTALWASGWTAGGDMGRTWIVINGVLAALLLGLFLRPSAGATAYSLGGAALAAWLSSMVVRFGRTDMATSVVPFVSVVLAFLSLTGLRHARDEAGWILRRVPLDEVTVPRGGWCPGRGVRGS